MQGLSKELRAWLGPGLAGMLVTVDASGQPEIARVYAYRVVDNSDAIELCLLKSGSERTVRNIAEGARAAFNAIEVHSYRSRSFKGDCTLAREVDADEAFVAQSLIAMGRSFTQVVGMPEDVMDRMLAGGGRTFVCVLLRVDSVYDQSPKPGAGARL